MGVTGNGAPASLIEIEAVRKIYAMGKRSYEALRGVDLRIAGGEFVSIMGPSGSGKSTLMNIVGCLDNPSAGTYRLSGRDVTHLGETELARVRNRQIGFVFQTFNLLPRATALANVELPLVYAGVPARERQARAQAALAAVGLTDWAAHKPSELSGGQCQRVAVARALVIRPKLLLADEPTGNLDSATAEEMLLLFKEIHSSGNTVIIVTHAEEVACRAARVIHIRDGKIVGDEPVRRV